jgi:hypothetical protein
MDNHNRPVFEAIERWEEKALVSAELAGRLRLEIEETSHAGTERMGQYVIAATGAAVLLIAAGVFLDWAWPRMGDPSRTGLIAAVGIAVHVWGVWIEGRHRWLPASYLMQTSGLALLLTAVVYSNQAWDDLSLGGVLIGVAALATPVVLAPRSLRRNVVMPAVHLCFGLAFLAVFLDRATGLSSDAIIWTLDAVLAVAALLLVQMLGGDPEGERHPWALNGFVAAVYAGFFLVLSTGLGPLGLRDSAVYPLDAWLVLVAALTLWGIHRAPVGLRRAWFEDQLAFTILLWIPLGIYTVSEAFEGPSELVLLLVGAAGVAGFLYAKRFAVRRVLATSALAFIAAVWYWAVDRAGALGAVVALGVTAVLLFWISGKAGGKASAGGGRDASGGMRP